MKRRPVSRKAVVKMSRNVIRIATRGSALAKIQAAIVREKLLAEGFESEIAVVRTKGDRDRKSPLQQIGGDGLFVRSIERKLLEKEADIAVHSAKDLPYELAEGLMIGAIADEADPRDRLLICGKELPAEPVIGTDSPRREKEFLQIRPDARFKSLRGNVPTRIQKLARGEYDGILLAEAGIARLRIDVSSFGGEVLETSKMLPSPGQGLIAVECRTDDQEMVAALEKIHLSTAGARYRVERYLFEMLRADCSSAIGVHAQIEGGRVRIRARFEENKAEAGGPLSDYIALCNEIREKIYK